MIKRICDFSNKHTKSNCTMICRGILNEGKCPFEKGTFSKFFLCESDVWKLTRFGNVFWMYGIIIESKD